MPQLDISTWPPQLFWLAVTFGLLYYIVSRMIIPRTGAVIEKRKSTIDGDIAAASQHKLDAEAALKAYEASLAEARAKAGSLSATARNTLSAEADSTIAKLNSELAVKISAAEKSIAAAKAKAMESIDSIAAELSSSIVGQLIGGETLAVAAPIRAAVKAPAKRKK
jgi:F-type H+-transporting ATPase subunit b